MTAVMAAVMAAVMRWAGLFVITGVGCARHVGELELADIKRDDLVVTVDVAGDLAAVDSTDVKPPVIPEASNFKISWLAPEGSEVVAGAPIVTFDSSDLDRNLEGLQSQAAEWRTQIDRMRQQATLTHRAEELSMLEQEASVQRATRLAGAPPDLVAPLAQRSNELDEHQAKAELELARKRTDYDRRSRAAELQSLVNVQATVAHQIEQLRQSTTRLALTSPRAGTVVYPGNYAGENKKIGDTVYSSDVVVQIVVLGAMIGNGHVDEADLARIAVHEPVALRVDALPDVGLHGTVASIASSVQPSDTGASNVVRLQVAIEATTTCALRPGMRFRGQVETQRIPSVIQIPAEAVFVTPEGPVAYRETTGGLERVRLSLGHRSTETFEVTAGLSPGDRVSRVSPEQEAR